MLGMIGFSLIGTILFALIALGLVWLMAILGGGQRARIIGARPQGEASRRPRRSSAQRSRR